MNEEKQEKLKKLERLKKLAVLREREGNAYAAASALWQAVFNLEDEMIKSEAQRSVQDNGSMSMHQSDANNIKGSDR